MNKYLNSLVKLIEITDKNSLLKKYCKLVKINPYGNNLCNGKCYTDSCIFMVINDSKTKDQRDALMHVLSELSDEKNSDIIKILN